MDTKSLADNTYVINSTLHIMEDGGQARPSNSSQVNSILGSNTLTFIFRIFFEDNYQVSDGKYHIMSSIGKEKAPNGKPLGFYMYVEKSSYGAYLCLGDGNYYQTFKIPVNQWIDCAIVIDIPQGDFNPYINGELYHIPLGWDTPLTGRGDVVIGSRPNTPWMNFRPFPGYIQYISIFNKALDKQSVIDYTANNSLDMNGFVCKYSFENAEAILQTGVNSGINNKGINTPITLTEGARILPIKIGSYREAENNKRIDLSNVNITPRPIITEPINFYYSKNYKSWYLSRINSSITLNFELNEVQDIYFVLQTCCITNGNMYLYINVNDKRVVNNFQVSGRTPRNEHWKIASTYLKEGKNKIILGTNVRDNMMNTSDGALVRYASIVLSKKENYTIDFKDSKSYKNILSFSEIVGRYRGDLKCWCLKSPGIDYAQFNLFLSEDPSQKKVRVGFELYYDLSSENANSPIEILVNNNVVGKDYRPTNNHFHRKHWLVKTSYLKKGDNSVKFRMSSGASTSVFINSAFCIVSDLPSKGEDWMSFLNDNISIGKINLPGTHDSAATSKTISYKYFYDCHDTSITEQLNGGIRLFDIRLKVKKDSNNQYYFVTCHGNIGFWTMNEYAPFRSVMDEFIEFLDMHNKEALVMSLKIDDWNGYDKDKVKDNVYSALKSVLYSYQSYIYRSSSLPSLGSVRGKIFVFNRMSGNNNAGIGCTIDWKDNTDGSNAYQDSSRNFSVFVQDKYEGLASTCDKLKVFVHAFDSHDKNDVVINFASGVWNMFQFDYIHDTILNYFGSHNKESRRKLGWIFMDYEFKKSYTSTYGQIDLVKYIIDSNFDYVTYPEQFTIKGATQCNLS